MYLATYSKFITKNWVFKVNQKRNMFYTYLVIKRDILFCVSKHEFFYTRKKYILIHFFALFTFDIYFAEFL